MELLLQLFGISTNCPSIHISADHWLSVIDLIVGTHPSQTFSSTDSSDVQILQSGHGVFCSLQLFLAPGGGHLPPHAALHRRADQETSVEAVHAARMGYDRLLCLCTKARTCMQMNCWTTRTFSTVSFLFLGTPVLFVTPWTVVKILYENTEWVFECTLHSNRKTNH